MRQKTVGKFFLLHILLDKYIIQQLDMYLKNIFYNSSNLFIISF